MNDPASRIIVDVERAAGDLRRGLPVLLAQSGCVTLMVMAGEHHPEQETIQDAESPAVRLLKLSGLLPHAMLRPVAGDEGAGLLTVSAEAIAAYPAALASTLMKVSEARVPLPEAPDARFIAFRSRFGHEEHLAVVVGDVASQASPPVRLHSSCVTGDIFASLRCDCGAQLHQALRMIAGEGCGAVLYLSQEGRGIGIANKLRAYALQDEGMDTVEANIALGFAADERDFAVAAEMLRQLGLKTITLLTNNPRKITELERLGIRVAHRKPVITTPTGHNHAYLAAKTSKMGHLE